MSRPRVIRKVTKVGQDGYPKVATDRKDDIRLERVRAMYDRPCEYPACTHGGVLIAGDDYAKVVWSRSKSFYFKNSLVRVPMDFHFECVPPEAKPLVRFFYAR